MNKIGIQNGFDINSNSDHHWCDLGCGVDFYEFTCYINRYTNQYYTNSKFDFNRILGKFDEHISIDKIYYLQLTI